MGATTFAAILAAAIQSPSQDAETEWVELSDRIVRVNDLADAPANLAQKIVTTIPKGAASITLGADAQTRLLRLRLPGQKLKLRYKNNIRFVAPLPSPKKAPSAKNISCLATQSPVDGGEFLSRSNVKSVECQLQSARADVVFDRQSRALRAETTLPAGTYLGPIRLPASKIIDRGTKLTLVTGEGPVVIERQVKAVQSGRYGQMIFVQTNNGLVFASKLAFQKKEKHLD